MELKPVNFFDVYLEDQGGAFTSKYSFKKDTGFNYWCLHFLFLFLFSFAFLRIWQNGFLKGLFERFDRQIPAAGRQLILRQPLVFQPFVHSTLLTCIERWHLLTRLFLPLVLHTPSAFTFPTYLFSDIISIMMILFQLYLFPGFLESCLLFFFLQTSLGALLYFLGLPLVARFFMLSFCLALQLLCFCGRLFFSWCPDVHLLLLTEFEAVSLFLSLFYCPSENFIN